MSNVKSMYAIAKLKRNIKPFNLRLFKADALKVYEETCQLLAEGDQSRLRQVSGHDWKEHSILELHQYPQQLRNVTVLHLCKSFWYNKPVTDKLILESSCPIKQFSGNVLSSSAEQMHELFTPQQASSGRLTSSEQKHTSWLLQLAAFSQLYPLCMSEHDIASGCERIAH